jgi:DNA-binding CsgD family transcriptional regulator
LEHQPSPTVTNRERDVCALFSRGLTYDEVAHVLGISVNTVRQHVRSLYKKLDVSSKIEAVLALRARALLVDP